MSLLQTQQWEKADRETQEKVAYLLGSFYHQPLLPGLITPFLPEATDISKIPCTDLSTIDLLWTKFSEGRFGFSVQKKIVENDNKLPSPEEIKDLCIKQCNQREAPRSIVGVRNLEEVRCKRGCDGLRFEAQVKRIPEAMGRGRSTVVNPLPSGYYPSPIEVRNLDADAYRELAKRANQCHV